MPRFPTTAVNSRYPPSPSISASNLFPAGTAASRVVTCHTSARPEPLG
jgi:hypothetical protein